MQWHISKCTLTGKCALTKWKKIPSRALERSDVTGSKKNPRWNQLTMKYEISEEVIGGKKRLHESWWLQPCEGCYIARILPSADDNDRQTNIIFPILNLDYLLSLNKNVNKWYRSTKRVEKRWIWLKKPQRTH